jgi:uncharacterized protein involved in exopolysaccharide biosynthesis
MELIDQEALILIGLIVGLFLSLIVILVWEERDRDG